MSNADKQHELAELKQRVEALEAELNAFEMARLPRWRPQEYYTAYYATTGFMLGLFGAAASLLFNVVGSLIFGKYPLELIRVYLTFPMGARALELDAIDDGMVLAMGCCLYLATGMLYGIPFQLVLTRFLPQGTFRARLVLVSVLSLALWLVNFGVLSWLQPLLFGGNWIVELIPWWVAALTHLVFGWTMLLVYPLGLYRPYEGPVENL